MNSQYLVGSHQNCEVTGDLTASLTNLRELK